MADQGSDDDLVEASQQIEYLSQVLGNDSANLSLLSDDETSRFNYLTTQQDLNTISKSAVPKNTQKRNTWSINTFTKWAIWRNNQNIDEQRKMKSKVELMGDEELSYWLSRFVVEVRKENGQVYPPSSLLSLVMGLQSFILMETKRNIDLLNRPTFEDFRQVLDGELKRLSNLGLGQSKRQAEPIRDDEESKLWEKGILGTHNPRVLINTLVYLNGKHFALRSGQEHRNLRYRPCQITMQQADGNTFLRYKEDVSKTCQGGLKHRKITPKVVDHYESCNKDRCHVAIFKKYISVCPDDNRDDAFYLTPLQKYGDNIWYSRQAMGHNSLQKIVPDLCKKGGISGHKTNHSLRVTTATSLYEKGIDEQLIMERTGHRSIEGVRAYKRTSDGQKKEVSAILNRETPAAQPASPETPTPETPTPKSPTQITDPSKMPVIHATNCVFNIHLK